LLVAGCTSNFILEPIKRGLTSSDPGDFWDPTCSEWYCPIPPYTPQEIEEALLPDCGAETDLAGLIDLSLRNHPQTRIAWSQARAGAYAVGMSESAYYPSVVGSEAYFIDNATSFGTSTTGNIIGGGSVGIHTTSKAIVGNLVISYLILDFGGREAAVKSTRYALQALNWTQNRVIQQVIINVIQAYYNYIDAKGMLIAKLEDLKNADADLAATIELKKAGVVREVDLLQAQANRENAILAVKNAQNQVNINLGVLAVALGIPPTTEFLVKDLPERFPVHDICATVDNLMEMARKNRPDLASAYANVLENKMNLASAISASLPTITANVNLQQASFLNNTGFSGHNYLGVVSVNFPIFSGFFFENQIGQAKANLKAAEANFDNLETMALLDVVTSYYNFMTSKENLQYTEKYLQYADEAYKASFVNYKNGAGSLLDLLSAWSTLSDARALRVQARTNWAIALFNIAFSTGTLDPAFVAEEIDVYGCDPQIMSVCDE